MSPRGKRAVGRTRGSTASIGRGRISVEPGEENLIEILNNIPISHAQQQLLDEESGERDHEAMDDADNNTTVSNVTEPLPPPGNPIPIFNVQSWKAKWRRDFFTDWRWAEKKRKALAIKFGIDIRRNTRDGVTLLNVPKEKLLSFCEWIEKHGTLYKGIPDPPTDKIEHSAEKYDVVSLQEVAFASCPIKE
ncbi:hypothetical protein DAPPUDRAFT_107738 [Daphnia pulex]|uniref:Uncharacterized protein n=1 Tax=Daphnia pulex TaxID=6669 RepID=E9GY27_DAPPU|nr:hypothetical protein DAPPUDRAFT_107738 [Daphnia pulex]|eukprot:EFX75526.1 hypothetical protein DAPPUDRAFT_107738 [Daphnia pulex]